jgi:elongation factor Ts
MPKYIQSYMHNHGQIGVLIEIECRDDATTKTKEFLELASSLAMQIAATNPVALSPTEIADVTSLRVARQGKMVGSISQEQKCLLTQAFVKQPSKTVQMAINEASEVLGENLRVVRFVRFDTNET